MEVIRGFNARFLILPFLDSEDVLVFPLFQRESNSLRWTCILVVFCPGDFLQMAVIGGFDWGLDLDLNPCFLRVTWKPLLNHQTTNPGEKMMLGPVDPCRALIHFAKLLRKR